MAKIARDLQQELFDVCLDDATTAFKGKQLGTRSIIGTELITYLLHEAHAISHIIAIKLITL